VGEPARRQALTNADGTMYAFKRRMGETYKFKVRGKEYTPNRYLHSSFRKLRMILKNIWEKRSQRQS